MKCGKCGSVIATKYRCHHCGASLAGNIIDDKEIEAKVEKGELSNLGKFIVTLVCAYVFSFLLVMSIGCFWWVLNIWFHVANILCGIMGIFCFHQITNYMRDHWGGGDDS